MTDISNLKYVQVPMIVLLDEDVSSTAKLLMGLITTLTMQEGFCYANNRWTYVKFLDTFLWTNC